MALSTQIEGLHGRSIVAFDFDGTLTHKDSFTSFLRGACEPASALFNLTRRPGILLDYLRTNDRGALKSSLLYNLLAPITKAELERKIAEFVRGQGLSLFRSDALTTWEKHANSDALRIIVTASPELLVAPFGALIGADCVIGTRLAFSTDGALMRTLDGKNCRGLEKVVRMEQTFGRPLKLEDAYGDTRGDLEMLAAARRPHYRVFSARP